VHSSEHKEYIKISKVFELHIPRAHITEIDRVIMGYYVINYDDNGDDVITHAQDTMNNTLAPQVLHNPLSLY
jgi:hypothetical protein